MKSSSNRFFGIEGGSTPSSLSLLLGPIPNTSALFFRKIVQQFFGTPLLVLHLTNELYSRILTLSTVTAERHAISTERVSLRRPNKVWMQGVRVLALFASHAVGARKTALSFNKTL